MRRVAEAEPHSWGYELGLECGHGHFHFSSIRVPPMIVACAECEAEEEEEDASKRETKPPVELK